MLVRKNFYFRRVKSFNVNLFLPDTVHSAILKRAKAEGVDWDYEVNGYPKWKHRVDRAAQKVLTDV